MFTDLDDGEDFTALTFGPAPFEDAHCGTLAPRIRPLKPDRSQRALTRLERALVQLKVSEAGQAAGAVGREQSAGSETVACLECGTDDASAAGVGRRPAERRAFPRRESGCEVLVHRMPSGAVPDPLRLDWLLHSSRLRGQLVDISMSGAAFLLAERVEAHERMSLRFLDGQRKQNVDTRGTVLRVSPGEAGAWKVVCKLDANLSFEQVTRLGRSLAATRYV